jgi:hypothetical protein
VGNAAGDQVTSWLSPAPVLVGALAVVFSGYLAAVYLAADSLRYAEPELGALFRRRALLAGVISGGLALAGLLVMRGSGLNLTHGAALALVCVSGVAGLATLALCWASRFGLARLTAALAVAAVVVGWAAAQAPRFLPGMTVAQAAAGGSTLVALIVAVACGAVVLVPSLALLYTLFLRGRLDTPEAHAPGEAPVAPPSPAELSAEEAEASPREAAAHPAGAAVPSPASRPGTSTDTARSAAPGGGRGPRGAGDGSRGAPSRGGERAGDGGPRGPARPWGAAAVAGLAAGAGLLVFADAPWAHVLGVASLLLCAVSVFALIATPLDR